MFANKAGDRIRIARAMQKPRITQDDLIARLDFHGVNMRKNTLSRIETGARYITDLELIAFSKVLNVSIPWLLEETQDPQIKK